MPETSDIPCRKRHSSVVSASARRLAAWALALAFAFGRPPCAALPAAATAASTAPLSATANTSVTLAGIAEISPTSATLDTSATANSGADARTSAGVKLQWRAHEGQRWRVEFAKRLRADTVVARGLNREKLGTETELRIAYTEQVLTVRRGMPSRVRRKVERAGVVTRNPYNDAEESDEPSYVGVDAEFQIDEMGALTAEKVLDGTKDAAEQFADESFFYSVLPAHDVREGDSWNVPPSQLSGLLLAIDASEGEAGMRFAGIDHPPGGGQIAGIIGTVRALIRFREHDQAARLEGRYIEQFNLTAGFPAERRVTGELTIEFQSDSDGARQTVTGSGDMEVTELREPLDDAPTLRIEDPDAPAPGE